MSRLFFSAVGLVAVLLLVGCESKPGIEKIEPSAGSVAGLDDVMIHGAGFKAGMTVFFGNRTAKRIVVDSPTLIRVKNPPGKEGKTDVIVTAADGNTFMVKGGFTYTTGQ